MTHLDDLEQMAANLVDAAKDTIERRCEWEPHAAIQAREGLWTIARQGSLSKEAFWKVIRLGAAVSGARAVITVTDSYNWAIPPGYELAKLEHMDLDARRAAFGEPEEAICLHIDTPTGQRSVRYPYEVGEHGLRWLSEQRDDPTNLTGPAANFCPRPWPVGCA